MKSRKLWAVGAIVAGLLPAVSALAVDPTVTLDSPDRTAATPSSSNESKPSESYPNRDAIRAPRGDNPNLPNPVTPSASNESAPQPQSTLGEPTNASGMGEGAVGATR